MGSFVKDTYGYDFEILEAYKWYKLDKDRKDYRKLKCAIFWYIRHGGLLEFNNNYTLFRRILPWKEFIKTVMIKAKDLTIPFNYVLIKPDSDHEYYQMNGRDTGIRIGSSVDAAGQVVAVTGTVYSTPKRLRFLLDDLYRAQRHFKGDEYDAKVTKIKEDSVRYDVPVETEVGDKVVFFYKNQFDVYQKGRVFHTDEGILYLMRYDDLFCTYKGSDDFYPLNGYIFIEPVELKNNILEGSDFEVSNSGLISPTFTHQGFGKKKKVSLGKVTHVGCICKGYIDFPDQSDDRNPLNIGDYIVYSTNFAQKIQYELHQTLSEKQRLRLHRKDILGVIAPEPGLDIQQVLSNFKIK